MSERALVFGTAAQAYEQHRLGYPHEVADLTLAYAHGPVERALEVGAGTGKATPLFARDVGVTAVEPDPAMAAVLRRTAEGLPVRVVVATFEELATDGAPYDLLFAGSAWHWTEPATRWDQTAALLRSGGTVALFGSGRQGSHLVDDELQREVSALRDAVIVHEVRATEGRSASGTWWPGSELEDDPRFVEVEEHDIGRVVTRTRAEHLAVLGTLSDFLQLPGLERETLLGRIGERLPDTLEVNAAVRLHLARRV